MKMNWIILSIMSFVLFIPNIFAYSSVAIMDADSMRVLYSENEDKNYLIASTTNIMTT